ncbi:MAG: DUF4890 domain-containing protein [Bacteroidetes bacterium]|nr:DUF4890 domain-containing protein [Fibrella sp.]
MLKKTAFGGLILSLLALPLLAQKTTPPAATAGKNNQTLRYQPTDPATRARRQTDQMTRYLSLDQATSKKLYAVNLDRAQKAEAIMKGTDASKSKAKALRENTDAYKTKLREILTPEQMAKVEQMQEQRQDRARSSRENDPVNE